MNVRCDLHTHTTASDGQYTPTELVGLAKKRGLSVLAVTDHDTIAGVGEAQQAGNALGLRVIRGVELSAKDHPNCHILGYGFRDGDTELARLCEKFRAGRDERKYKIVDFLREKGAEVDLAEVEELAGGEVIARPHFAQILVRRGYVSTNREAFDRYLDTEEFRQRVKRFKADAKTCVEAIKEAGGKVSLAHPYQMGLSDGELDRLVDDRAIVELYHRREERAIAETDKKYGGLCRSIALRLLGVREDAEECVNDTWHAAWNRIPPDWPRSLGPFLGRITRNLSVSRWRRERAQKRFDGMDAVISELEDCVPAPGTVEEQLERRQLARAISVWLDELEEGDRRLFVRRYWYGVPVKELAAERGEGANALSQRLLRLRKALRAFLESEGVEI